MLECEIVQQKPQQLMDQLMWTSHPWEKQLTVNSYCNPQSTTDPNEDSEDQSSESTKGLLHFHHEQNECKDMESIATNNNDNELIFS